MLRRLYAFRTAAALARRSMSSSGDPAAWKPYRPDSTNEKTPFDLYTPTGKLKKDIFHYTDRKAGSGYSHFSTEIYPDRPYIWPPLRRAIKFNIILSGIVLVLLVMVDWEKADDLFSLHAAQQTEEERRREEKEEEEDEKNACTTLDGNKEEGETAAVTATAAARKRKRAGFRERRVVEYENRLRMYSSPEKVFRYFATLKVLHDDGVTFDVYMTPTDFLRSLTPGVMQPRTLGLDHYKVFQPNAEDALHNKGVAAGGRDDGDGTIFKKLGDHGLISFSDYLFLITLLSTSPHDFELAFKIFDVNGDGQLDKTEFRAVQELVLSQSAAAHRYRDHPIGMGSTAAGSNNHLRLAPTSSLESYFFGADLKAKLPAAKFLEFQAALHRDILKMEFDRRVDDCGGNGKLPEREFARMLLQYAELDEKKEKLALKRLRQRIPANERRGLGFDEVSAFFQLLYHVDRLDMALHFHKMAGTPVDAATLQRAARRVADGLQLSDHVVRVVVALFDEDGDERLCEGELVRVMRRRLQRGLERPKDTGFFRALRALAVCSHQLLIPSASAAAEFEHGRRGRDV